MKHLALEREPLTVFTAVGRHRTPICFCQNRGGLTFWVTKENGQFAVLCRYGQHNMDANLSLYNESV